MKNIFEVHRKVKNNVGDLFCNPSRYFNFTNCKSGELVNNNFPITGETILVGGGGLIHKKFQNHIQSLIQKNPKNIILWGIGHNFGRKHVTKSKSEVYYPDWVKQCTLVGIRDWIKNYEHYYLPCVSCMHPAFDKNYKVTKDVVFFTHAFKSSYVPNKLDNHMSNDNINFDEVIEFLASANTIITDSYHGVYWGQLLNKDVRTLSWSVKFDHMKYSPSFIDSVDNWHKSKKSQSYNGFLEESRNLNIEFSQKVFDLL